MTILGWLALSPLFALFIKVILFHKWDSGESGPIDWFAEAEEIPHD